MDRPSCRQLWQMPGHHSTVDDRPGVYLAFPDVVETAQGELLAVYRESDTHRATRSRLLLCRSTDGGRSWGMPEPFAEPLSLADDHAVWNCPRLSRLQDNRIVVVADVAFFARHLTTQSGRDDNNWDFNTYLWFGDCEGRDFGPPQLIHINGLVPSRIVELNDGTLLLSSHRRDFRNPKQRHQVVARSFDGGRHWGVERTVACHERLQLCEGSPFLLTGGQLACFLRENSGQGLPTYLVVSTDQGYSWSEPRPTPMVGHRPVGGLLADGRVLCTYRDVSLLPGGGRDPASLATRAWLGQTIDDPQGLFVELEYAGTTWGDYGYSGWVERQSGEVVCLYHTCRPGRTPRIRAAWFTPELLR
jgi:hypothetical protein